MPATRSMFVIILVVAVISFAALMVIQLME
jgi:hypothetical protein